jgi:hypothetical protein
MSTDYSDIWEFGMESDCCGAGVYINGICSYCNDHCTPVDEEERELMDVYRDVGMSPSDFI